MLSVQHNAKVVRKHHIHPGNHGAVGLKRLLVAALLACPALGWSQPLRAQALRGIVVAAGDSLGIPGVLIRLVDSDGRDKAIAVADSIGRYHLAVPEPGEYRLAAAHFGYHAFQSPLLSITGDQTYPIDIELVLRPKSSGTFTASVV